MTTKAAVLQAIRRKCLDCSVYQPAEVRECTAYTCDLHPYRFGRDPNPAKGIGFGKQYASAADSDNQSDMAATTAWPPKLAGEAS